MREMRADRFPMRNHRIAPEQIDTKSQELCSSQVGVAWRLALKRRALAEEWRGIKKLSSRANTELRYALFRKRFLGKSLGGVCLVFFFKKTLKSKIALGIVARAA